MSLLEKPAVLDSLKSRRSTQHNLLAFTTKGHRHVRQLPRVLLSTIALASLLLLPVAAHAAPERIAPKVLIITTYEIGKDSGDKPGELQFWVEREHLDQSIVVPGVEHSLLTNGKGLYAMICGITSRSAVTMMALAMDPRFDLSHTYFLLDGIAGGDPAQTTLGSAVWVRQVVDGDPRSKSTVVKRRRTGPTARLRTVPSGSSPIPPS